MTYKELAKKIKAMTKEQKNSTVTIYDQNEEWYAAKLDFTEETDVLDENHPYILFDDSSIFEEK